MTKAGHFYRTPTLCCISALSAVLIVLSGLISDSTIEYLSSGGDSTSNFGCGSGLPSNRVLSNFGRWPGPRQILASCKAPSHNMAAGHTSHYKTGLWSEHIVQVRDLEIVGVVVGVVGSGSGLLVSIHTLDGVCELWDTAQGREAGVLPASSLHLDSQVFNPFLKSE